MIWRPKKPHLILPGLSNEGSGPQAGDEDYQPPGLCFLMGHRMMMAAAGGSVPAYRYFRLDFTALESGTEAKIGQIRWKEGATVYPTVNMTSNTAPSPLVALNSTSYASTWKVHDGDPASPDYNIAAHTSGWIQIDLGAGNEISPDSMDLTASGSEAFRMPKTFTLRASNDAFASEDVQLAAPSDQTGWSNLETRNFAF